MCFHLNNLIQSSSGAANRATNLLDQEIRQRVTKKTNLSRFLPFEDVKTMILKLQDDDFEADLLSFCIG